MGERHITTLGCADCKDRNYTYQRGRRKEYKVEVKKFCPRCGKQTAHKEVK